MALLNYKGTFSQDTLSTYTGNNVTQANRLKIVVMPDSDGVSGHLITHGIDFGRTFDGARGLVPALPSGATAAQSFLRGNGWSALWTQATETAEGANKDSYLQSTLVSAYDIKRWIAESFAANDAMRFKGTIKVDNSDNVIVNGVANSGFPTTCEVGDTYKVVDTTIGKILANAPVQNGDLLICIKDGTGANLNDSQYWTVAQSNVESLSTFSLNNTSYQVYTQSYYTNFTFFAPVDAGTSGYVLIASGNNAAPTWAAQSTLVVGEAAKVTHALENSTGIAFKSGTTAKTQYDGSETITMSLLPATNVSIGGVIIDGGTKSILYDSTNAPSTKYPTISVDNNGEVYLTRTNIINALGFTPGNANGSVTAIVASNSASSVSNAQTASPYINIVGDANNVLASFQLAGSGNIGVNSTGTSNVITISLNAADQTNYGGIKLGYSDVNEPKNYAVQLDSNGKAYVNVPWVSNVFTASTNGLAPAASDANKQTNSSDNVASNTTFLLGADAKWYKLPSSSFQGDRRIVKLNTNTEVIAAASGNALDIVAGTHVTIAAEQTTGANPTYTGKLTFNATWRDIQVHKLSGGTLASTASSIGDNSPLVLDNSESVYMIGVDDNNTTTVSAYLTWYNMDNSSYELV